MMIEKRYQARTDTRIEAEIRYRNRSFPATVTDISSGGLGLQTRNLQIPRGNMVGIHFRLGDTQWRLRGLIVERAGDRLSVMFPEPQPELARQAAIHAPIPATLPAGTPAGVPCAA